MARAIKITSVSGALTVTITGPNGGTPVVYADSSFSATQSMPATIADTATTTFWLQGPGRYTLSVKTSGGTEIAADNNSTRTVDVETDGTVAALNYDARTLATVSGDSGHSTASSAASGTTPATTGYDVILLAGQSNMSGGAGPAPDLTHLDPTDKDIWQFVNGGITLALDPLSHPDNTSFVGPGMAFARWWASSHPGRRVLLVPRAYQGTGFATVGGSTWDPATVAPTLYTQAISTANDAIVAAQAIAASSKIVAFLWHQGENDAWSSWTQAQYAAKLDALIAGFRAGVTGATASTPFVLGRMVPDWIGTSGSLTSDQIDKAHADTPRRVAYTWVARGASGLNDGANIYHYSAPGQRLMGQRMFFALTNALANNGSTNIVPDQPSDPTLTIVPGSGQNVLAWLPSNSNLTVTGYEVWKGTATGTETLLTTLGNVLTYPDTAVVDGTTYFYKIRALNAAGASAFSTEKFGTYTTQTVIASDNFNRANTAAPTNNGIDLGTTPVGAKTWVRQGLGFQHYIDSSQALLVPGGTPSAACATVDAGVADVDVRATMNSGSIAADKEGIVVRYTDENNYVVLSTYGTALYKLIKITAGVAAQMGADISVSPTIGDILRVIAKATVYTVYINGVQKLTVTDAGPSTTAHLVGLRLGNPVSGPSSSSFVARFDDFSVLTAP